MYHNVQQIVLFVGLVVAGCKKSRVVGGRMVIHFLFVSLTPRKERRTTVQQSSIQNIHKWKYAINEDITQDAKEFLLQAKLQKV